jgi:hypothetical protein
MGEKSHQRFQTIDTFFGKFWVLWTFYFMIPQFIVDGIFQSNGYLFAYTGYHWILHTVLFISGLIISKWYSSTTVKIFTLPLVTLEGYMYFRYLQPETWYFNPYVLILNIVVLILMGLQIVWCLFAIFRNIVVFFLHKDLGNFKPKTIRNHLQSESKVYAGLIIVVVALSCTLPIANAGFYQKITINDEGHTPKRVGFWSFSWRGLNVSNYDNQYAKDELAMLRDINGFLMFQIHKAYLENPKYYTQFTELVRLYESYDVEIVLNANPETWVLDEKTGKWVERGDYVTYHHTEVMNYTIDLIINWIKTENFTNVIGLSFDTEGPVYNTPNSTISKEQYNAAIFSYNEKLKEFKTEFPEMETMQISMESMFWDPIDSDDDLSIEQKTVDYSANFDKYGYMTYQLSDNPDYSSYKYYTSMVQGHKVHGDKFQPWLGWITDQNSMLDPNFNRTFWEQLKIAKNFASDDIIIGYYPTFVGKDHNTTLNRLRMLGEVLYSKYQPFEISISHRKWNDNIFPTYWMSSESIIKDVINGHTLESGVPLPWYAILETIIFVAGFLYIVKGVKNYKEILKLEKEKKANWEQNA